MSEKHSPGPWEVHWTKVEVINPAGRVVARRDWKDSQDDPVMRANMRLIAAAPEMLGLLNKARHIGSIGYCPWCSEWSGHFTSCELVALLARIDGEPTP